MNTYIFTTRTTMKDYNRNNYWIMPDIVRDVRIYAETVKEALTKYAEEVKSRDYIEISKTALKNKSPMFIDNRNGISKQIGYVITGSTDIEKGDYMGWTKQYIDLWVKIETVMETEF